MNLKFIGTDGYKGFKHGEIYDVVVISGCDGKDIRVNWYRPATVIVCSYPSPAAFAANWATPGQKVVVRRKGVVRDGPWRVDYKKTVDPVKGVKNETD